MKTATLLTMSLLFLLGANTVAHEDACQKAIPRAVKKLIAKKYPGELLPKVADCAPEDVAYNIRQGGTGCIRVAVGDFNGDHINDYAVILHSPKTYKARLLVALSSGDRWQLISLFTWQDGNGANYYVGAVPPGEYTSAFVEEEAEPCVPTAVDRFVAKNEAIEFGITESSSTVYILSQGHWYSVWTSD